MAINLVVFSGNLGGDPELKTLPSGTSVCNFRMANTEKYKKKDGETVEHTEWKTIVIWGSYGIHCAETLSRGDTVCVRGKLKTRQWEDKETGAKMERTEIDLGINGECDFIKVKKWQRDQGEGQRGEYGKGKSDAFDAF